MARLQQVNAEFKQRLTAGEPLLGAFIKTPHPIVIEIMGSNGFDFLVLDAEHAPFDRSGIDMMMIAGRAVETPLIVRIPASSSDWTLNILDAGAAGLMVPHVLDAEQAGSLVQAVTYGRDGRGFAGTTRAASYAQRNLREHLKHARDEVSLICQIEDPEGAENATEIATVPGVDALFVGRADLAVSHGKSDFLDPDIAAMNRDILGVKGAATGLYCAPGEDLGPHRQAGGSLFVVGSEHTLMKQGAVELVEGFKSI